MSKRLIEKQLMPNGGYKLKPNGSLNSQYKGKRKKIYKI